MPKKKFLMYLTFLVIIGGLAYRKLPSIFLQIVKAE